MLRACFVLVGGILTGGFLALAVASSAQAGMQEDLADCSAARDRAAASACTRVIKSGRLPREQTYIGHFNRGTAYRRAGDHRRAIEDFDKVLALKPGFARAHEARGLAYDDSGEPTKALADIDEAVRLAPEEWRFLYARAAVLRAEGRREAALRDLDEAVRLAGDSVSIRLMRTLILADQGSYASARDAANRVLAQKEGAAAYYVRAFVAFGEGREGAAADDVDEALRLQPDFAAAHVLKGRLLEAKGEKSAARTRYVKAQRSLMDSFDGRSVARNVKARLAVLDNRKSAKKPGKKSEDVELALDHGGPLDCKVYLPAVGSVVTQKCSE